jgi:hypothetical protein
MTQWFVEKALPGLVGAVIVAAAILVWNATAKGNFIRFFNGVGQDEFAEVTNQIQQLREAITTTSGKIGAATNQIQQLRDSFAAEISNVYSMTNQIQQVREALATQLRESVANATGNFESATNQIQQLREALASATRGIASGGPGFMRLIDGTQICWGKAEVQFDASSDQRTIQATFTAFSETPQVLVGIHSAHGGKRLAATWAPYDETITTNEYRGKLFAAGGQNLGDQNLQFDYVAIGKFK